MKLEKEAIIQRTLIDFKTDKNKYPLYIDFKMMLNEKERKLIKEQTVNRNVKLILNFDIKEPILDEEERKYLKGVIRPFRDKINFIEKENFHTNKKTYEIIHFETKFENYKDDTWLPPFEKETMYKGMELNKEYTLDDLNL